MTRSPSPKPDDEHGLAEIQVDEEEVRRGKTTRALLHHTRQIPALRLLGTLLLGLAIVVYNAVVPATGGARYSAGPFVAGMLVYCLLSWLILRRWYERVRSFDLGHVFLGIDVLWFAGAIFVTGGTQSWLFFLLLIRVADQTSTSFRLVLWYAHMSIASYGLVLWAQATFTTQPIPWGVEMVKIAAIYLAALYIASTARAAESLRRRGTKAIRAGRTLIERLRQQTDSLEEARALAEDMSRAKSQFFANVSHELRTPLAGAIGFLDLLNESDLTPEQREYVKQVDAGTRTLKTLVDRLLDFSRIESSELALANVPLDVREIIESVVNSTRAAASEKGLAMTVDVASDLPAVLQGDPVRVRQIFTHLVDNAVKFTDEGSVKVTVRTGRRDDRTCELLATVSDTGIGIPQERQGHIYDLKQVDGSSTRRHGGIGLGLAIVSRVVKAMGGRLWLESEPGKGSAFHIELPLAVATPAL
ncbi:MAG TPA: ATP-binding protein [Polyangia bacterium]